MFAKKMGLQRTEDSDSIYSWPSILDFLTAHCVRKPLRKVERVILNDRECKGKISQH